MKDYDSAMTSPFIEIKIPKESCIGCYFYCCDSNIGSFCSFYERQILNTDKKLLTDNKKCQWGV